MDLYLDFIVMALNSHSWVRTLVHFQVLDRLQLHHYYWLEEMSFEVVAKDLVVLHVILTSRLLFVLGLLFSLILISFQLVFENLEIFFIF
jgi:hypothetical protein